MLEEMYCFNKKKRLNDVKKKIDCRKLENE